MSSSRHHDDATLERLDQLDQRFTVLSIQLEELSKAVSAQLEQLSMGTSLVQHQLADFRSAVKQQLTVLSANAVAAANAVEGFHRERGMVVSSGDAPAVELYLDLLERALTGTLTRDGSLSATGISPYDPGQREVGLDWPATAETMIGRARMRNLRSLLERAIADDVPGDFIETGVWRGGACIYARAILEARGDSDRRVFVADSFRGLPPPDQAAYPADAGDPHSTFADLAISREQVEENFRRYGLLDERVVFLEGWFKDTLPAAPIERLCVLRLDGDMYESTIQALDALYWKVSPKGFVIIDDYVLPACKQAVDDFRSQHGIRVPMHDVDTAAVWWQIPGSQNVPTAGAR